MQEEGRTEEEWNRDFVPSISGFSDSPGVFANFTRPFFFSFSLSLCHCGTVRGAREEVGNLANDVLKISDKVFFLLYDPSVLANFLNDKFCT